MFNGSLCRQKCGLLQSAQPGVPRWHGLWVLPVGCQLADDKSAPQLCAPGMCPPAFFRLASAAASSGVTTACASNFLQKRCNEEIRAARAVTTTLVDPAEAQAVAASPLFRGMLPPAHKIQARTMSRSMCWLSAPLVDHTHAASDCTACQLAGWAVYGIHANSALFTSCPGASLHCLDSIVSELSAASQLLQGQTKTLCQSVPSVPALQLTAVGNGGGGVVQGGLRVLEIDTLDRNPCGGTHLTSLAQLQLLQVVGTSRNKGHAMLTFLAGDRARAALAVSLRREARLNTVCTSPLAGVGRLW